MTPKEKAIELVDKFHYQVCNDCGISASDSTEFAAKQCALIAVDEMQLIGMQIWNDIFKNNPRSYYSDTNYSKTLEEIKEEIKNQ